MSERMISTVFPDEKVPDLYEVGNRVALGINLGSPFLGDGLRPLSPNTIQGKCPLEPSDLEIMFLKSFLRYKSSRGF